MSQSKSCCPSRCFTASGGAALATTAPNRQPANSAAFAAVVISAARRMRTSHQSVRNFPVEHASQARALASASCRSVGARRCANGPARLLIQHAINARTNSSNMQGVPTQCSTNQSRRIRPEVRGYVFVCDIIHAQRVQKQVNMSAYIVVEGTVRDKEALGRYGS